MACLRRIDMDRLLKLFFLTFSAVFCDFVFAEIYGIINLRCENVRVTLEDAPTHNVNKLKAIGCCETEFDRILARDGKCDRIPIDLSYEEGVLFEIIYNYIGRGGNPKIKLEDGILTNFVELPVPPSDRRKAGTIQVTEYPPIQSILLYGENDKVTSVAGRSNSLVVILPDGAPINRSVEYYEDAKNLMANKRSCEIS
jgi:hypothetical protein